MGVVDQLTYIRYYRNHVVIIYRKCWLENPKYFYGCGSLKYIISIAISNMYVTCREKHCFREYYHSKNPLPQTTGKCSLSSKWPSNSHYLTSSSNTREANTLYKIWNNWTEPKGTVMFKCCKVPYITTTIDTRHVCIKSFTFSSY